MPAGFVKAEGALRAVPARVDFEKSQDFAAF